MSFSPKEEYEVCKIYGGVGANGVDCTSVALSARYSNIKCLM